MNQARQFLAISTLTFILLGPLVAAPPVEAIGAMHGGIGADPSPILNSNFSIWTFGGHASAGDADVIHTLAQAGIKVMHVEPWWDSTISNPLLIFYNETFRTYAKEAINFSLYGILPSYRGGPEQMAAPIDKDDIWAIILGDEEPAWLRESEIYSSVSPDVAQFNDTYHSETGYYIKPIYEMNFTEHLTYTEWLNEKTVWVYDFLYDYVKSQVPHALVFQGILVPPLWLLADELLAAYEVKSDGFSVDCYYAENNPWLMHEGIRLYKASLPTKPLFWTIWGTIWDFLNEAGDGLYYRYGSFEQIRRETWLSYLSGVDVLGYFDWAPVGNNSFYWAWGQNRNDTLGRKLWRYIDNLAGQLAKLPPITLKPEVLVVGSGFTPCVRQVGLFTEYDIVNQRCFATTDIDLSQYSLILLTDQEYRTGTVSKVNKFVKNGGNVAFLAGVHRDELSTSEEIFPIEINTTESRLVGHYLWNLTTPNPLNVSLEMDLPLYETYVLDISNATDDFLSINGLFSIDDEGHPAPVSQNPLLLYHNSSLPESGWYLYFGGIHASTIPGTTYENYDFDYESDLYSLYKSILWAFAGFINITNSISGPDRENMLITQGLVSSDTLLAGIMNFENQSRTIDYSLDLSQFGFSEGTYWVHSLDQNASLGHFQSDGPILRIPLDIGCNGTRMLLISQTKPSPDYSVDIFPSIPDPFLFEESEPVFPPGELETWFILSVYSAAIATGSIMIAVGVVYYKRKMN